jgi:hypothetical protein
MAFVLTIVGVGLFATWSMSKFWQIDFIFSFSFVA